MRIKDVVQKSKRRLNDAGVVFHMPDCLLEVKRAYYQGMLTQAREIEKSMMYGPGYQAVVDRVAKDIKKLETLVKELNQ